MKTLLNKLSIVTLSIAVVSLGFGSCDRTNPTPATPDPTTVTDVDGNVYNVVRIGTQLWTLENLRTTHLNDGSSLATISGANDLIPAYTVHSTSSSYGNLYNWYAAKSGKLAPKGWHVPTEAEWKILEGYVGGANIAGENLRLGNWTNNPTGKTFNILATGYATYTGTYNGIDNKIAYWWASSEKTSGGSNGGECRRAYLEQPNLHWGVLVRGYFLGVRCVKD